MFPSPASLLRRLRSRQRRSKHFSQKICTPPTSLTGWGRVYPAQTVRSPESICQREEPSEWMALLFVSCEHYGSTDSSKICGNTPPAKLAECRPGNCSVRQTKPSALCADAVLRTELPDGRTTGSLRGPYSKKRCHPNGWHLFLKETHHGFLSRSISARRQRSLLCRLRTKKKDTLTLVFLFALRWRKRCSDKGYVPQCINYLILTDSTNHDPGELIIVHYSLPCLM